MNAQLGLAHFWSQGDLVTHTTAIILALLSLASWSVILSKLMSAWRATRSQERALVFEINEGGKFDVAAVDIQGITVFTKDELTPAIRTESGFSYSGTDVRGDEKMIQDYYGSRGYADARVDTQLTDAGPGKLNVTYNVFEGGKSL